MDYQYRRTPLVQYSGSLCTIIIEGYHRSNSQDIYGLLVQKGTTGPIFRISMDYQYSRVSLVQQSGYLWTISTVGYHWSNSQDLNVHSRMISLTQQSGPQWTISTEGYHRPNSQDLDILLVWTGITITTIRIYMDYQSRTFSSQDLGGMIIQMGIINSGFRTEWTVSPPALQPCWTGCPKVYHRPIHRSGSRDLGRLFVHFCIISPVVRTSMDCQ